MKNIFRALMLISVFCLAVPGRASAAGMGQFEFHPYLGLGVGGYNLKYSQPGFSQSNSVLGGYLQAGADFNDYLGAELRIGTTDKGTSSYPGGSVSLKADYLFSYLLKLQYPTTPELRLYALLGGTTGKGKVDVTVPAYPSLSAAASKTKTAFSFGVGLDYQIADQLRLGAEWVRYANDITVDSATNTKETVDGYTATLKYMF